MFRKCLLLFLVLPSLIFGEVMSFSPGCEDWEVDFTDYPVGEEEFYELAWGWENLPTPIENLEKGLFLSGNNHSDDLFMFARHKIEGLRPHTCYGLNFSVVIESNVPGGLVGIGGSPGEDVYFKVGAASEKPIKVEHAGYYRLNVDKGNQSQGGANAQVIGSLANGAVDPNNPQFLPMELHTEEPLSVMSDQNGELWIFLGTDSGFEGSTKFYIAQVIVSEEELK